MSPIRFHRRGPLWRRYLGLIVTVLVAVGLVAAAVVYLAR